MAAGAVVSTSTRLPIPKQNLDPQHLLLLPPCLPLSPHSPLSAAKSDVAEIRPQSAYSGRAADNPPDRRHRTQAQTQLVRFSPPQASCQGVLRRPGPPFSRLPAMDVRFTVELESAYLSFTTQGRSDSAAQQRGYRCQQGLATLVRRMVRV